MRVVPLAEAQAHLPELVESAASGEEILIKRDGQPPVSLVRSAVPTDLKDIRPTSVGGILRWPGPDDDLLEEMLGQ